MHLISGQTVSETVFKGFETIVQEGYYQPSRNGGCTSIFDVTFEVKNPRSRHLYLQGRKSNIFALIAETFWVMAGEDKLYPYLNFFLPRAPQYSDDGETWTGAYGPRLYDKSHMSSVVDLFKRDGLHTRRAFVPIHDPAKDSTQAIENRFGFGEMGKDRPCNLGVNFYVVNGNKFTTKVFQRSGDIIFGTGSINPFEFSFLHELMFNEVKKEYPDLELGPYRWHVTNAHLYDFSREQADKALEQSDDNKERVKWESTKPLIGPEVYHWRIFFKSLVSDFTDAIESTTPEETIGNLIANLGQNFVAYDVPLENNLMWDYVQLVAHYIAAKRGVVMPPLVVSHYDSELFYAVTNSGFRKFNIS